MSYYLNCEDELEEYSCSQCGSEREYGRVRASGLVRKDFLATLLANGANPVTWQTGITEGKIRVIPITSGNVDPGTPSELPGYGDQTSSNGPRDMTLVWNDPNYRANYAFYNGLKDMRSWVAFYKTSTLVHIYDKPAKIYASDPVEDDLDTEVVWQVTAVTNSVNLPVKFDATALDAIFACAAPEAPSA